MEYKECITNLVKVIGGGTPKTSIEEYWNGDIPWISIADFKNDNKYIIKTEKTITEKGLKNSSTKLLKKGDIIISARGTVGELGIITRDMAFNQSCYGLRVNEEIIRSEYLYYSLKNNINSIKNNTHGSVFDTITKETFEVIKINVVDFKKQDKIIKILSNIDKKILENNQINDNLHEIINQNYFKYLNELDDYIDLDIKDIFDFETGVEPGSKNYLDKPENNSIKFYRVGDMNSECKTFINKELSNGKFIDENDVVVSFDATIGRIGFGLKGSYSSGMKKISINNKYKNFVDNSLIYAYFNNKDTQNIMLKNARGTTILHASSSIDFMRFKYNDILLKKYNKLISVAFDKMKSIKKENEQLAKLRDTLLPKLLNGEIDLDKIEI